MKLAEGFALRQVADTWVVIPLGSASVDFNGMLTLNESGALLWKQMENGAGEQALADTLVREYGISQEQALADVGEFLQTLKAAGCLKTE